MILYNNIVKISMNRWIGYMLKVAFLLASSICFEQKYKKFQFFPLENFNFNRVEKNLCMLHGHAFVMVKCKY